MSYLMEKHLKAKFEAIMHELAKDNHNTNPKPFILSCMKLAYLLDREEWISVDILLPTQNGDYIISGRFTKDCPKEVYQAYYDHKKRRFSAHGIISKDVTHWQPLPKKPNQ